MKKDREKRKWGEGEFDDNVDGSDYEEFGRSERSEESLVRRGRSFGRLGSRRMTFPSKSVPFAHTPALARVRLKSDHSLQVCTVRLREVEVTIAEVSTTIEARQARSKQLALAAARTAEDNRGGDVAVLDMRGMTTEFDYFVLATGNSRRQLHAISEEIDRVLESELGDKRMGIEGYNESRWILLDYGTVVVHMFDEETRAYYALEDLWGHAERVPLPWRKEEEGEKGRGGEGEAGST